MSAWKKARARVRKHFPKARCVKWWSGERQWIISPTISAFNPFDLGEGCNPRKAWLNAAKKLKGTVKYNKERLHSFFQPPPLMCMDEATRLRVSGVSTCLDGAMNVVRTGRISSRESNVEPLPSQVTVKVIGDTVAFIPMMYDESYAVDAEKIRRTLDATDKLNEKMFRL